MLRFPPAPPFAVALAISLLLRRSPHAEHPDKEERYEESRQEDEDRRRVALSELKLADPHALIHERTEGLQLPVAQRPEQVVHPVGVEGAEKDSNQDGALQERQRYAEEALHHVCPVHPRGLVHVAGDGLEASQEQERHKRRRLPHVHQDGAYQEQRPVGEYRLADEAYGVRYVVDDPDLVLEHQPPHDCRNHCRERPRYQNGGPNQPPAPEGPVYRERYAQAEYELERHADYRKDDGVKEPLQKVGVLEHLDVILYPDERTERSDGGVGQAQHDAVQDREERYGHDDDQGGQDHVVGRAPLGIGEFLPKPTSPFLLSRCGRHTSPLFFVRQACPPVGWPNLFSLLHDAAQALLERLRTLLRGGLTLQDVVELLGHLERHVPVVRRNRPRLGVLDKHFLGQFDDRVRLLQLRVVVEWL